MSGLSDSNARNLRAEGVYIKETASAHDITNICVMVCGWITGFCLGITTTIHMASSYSYHGW